MNTSIFLAKALGLYLLILGLAMIYFKTRFRAIVKELTNSPGQLFLLGVISLIIGILIVLVHNHWTHDWRVAVTLLGWIILIQAIVRIYYPAFVVRMAKNITKNQFYYTITAITILTGAFLSYHGFLAR